MRDEEWYKMQNKKYFNKNYQVCVVQKIIDTHKILIIIIGDVNADGMHR